MMQQKAQIQANKTHTHRSFPAKSALSIELVRIGRIDAPFDWWFQSRENERRFFPERTIFHLNADHV